METVHSVRMFGLWEWTLLYIAGLMPLPNRSWITAKDMNAIFEMTQ